MGMREGKATNGSRRHRPWSSVCSIETRYDRLIDSLREAADPARPTPPAAEAYAETVRRHAYRVTDMQVESLLEAGLSEDEVFEVTVAAAASAGLERLEAGLRAMG
jgi:alkylhydroperoxidase family enzyme